LEVVAEPPLARTGQLSVTGTLYLPVEVSGQRSRRIGEAQEYVAFNEANVGEARALAAGDTVRAYGSVVVAAERVQLLMDVTEAARLEAAAYAARARAGDATLRDAKLAEVEAGRNQVLLGRTHTDLERAERELAILIGRQPGEARALLTLEPPSPPASLGSRVAEQVPTLAVSRAEAELFARTKERWAREATGPFSLILMAARDDFGQARIGGGLAYAFPTFRSNQGEQARADADRERALTEFGIKRNVIESRLALLGTDYARTLGNRHVLENSAIPASRAAVEAAVEMQRAGKSELLTVLVSRRDHAMLRLERLDLVQRQWAIVADIVTMTGVLP
jgi:cobalt-zinc-cadmium efflux system outer membrane protein